MEIKHFSINYYNYIWFLPISWNLPYVIFAMNYIYRTQLLCKYSLCEARYKIKYNIMCQDMCMQERVSHISCQNEDDARTRTFKKHLSATLHTYSVTIQCLLYI